MSIWYLIILLVVTTIISSIIGETLRFYIAKKQLGSPDAASRTSTFLADFIGELVFFIPICALVSLDALLSANYEIAIIPLTLMVIAISVPLTIIFTTIKYWWRKRKERKQTL